jgi:3-methyladenine DNA glycosylase AlkD
MYTLEICLHTLQAQGSEHNAQMQAHFGIAAGNSFGVTMPNMRAWAKQIGKNHLLALELWNSEVHEAKLLATLVAEPSKFTPKECKTWIADFYSWDVCDQACTNLFRHLPYITSLIPTYAKAENEFEKRFAFAQIAVQAVHGKKIDDEHFLPYFELCLEQAWDKRNFVKKAVNWAIRQMGKRSPFLLEHAIATCQILLEQKHPPAHWIAKDAMREFDKRKQ